jgi:P27 family predicted phage terminase small subunit
VARGTYRSDRAVSNEAAATGHPALPSWVKDADARKEFKRLTKTLAAMGLIGNADSNLLTRYAMTWVRWRRMVQILAATSEGEGELAAYKDKEGQVKHMAVSALHSVVRSLGAELGQMEGALGMSPSARSRIEVAPPAPPAKANGKSRFFDTSMRIAN